MADNRIKNYSLGTAGVIIDPSHLLPGVPEQGLTIGQNVIQDPRKGFAGAIRKRAGFARFNNAYAGGIILGGITMPIAELGGVPATAGGASVGTGDPSLPGGGSVGTGDGTGAPGATFDGGAPASAPAGAGAFGGGALFSGARLVIVGRQNLAASNNGGVGWYVTSKGFNDTAVLNTTPQAPCTVYSYPTFQAPFVNDLMGFVSCIGMDGRLYYAAEHGNQSAGGTVNGQMPIYVTDGATTGLLATIAKNAANEAKVNNPGDATVRAAIMAIHAGSDGFLYCAIKDKFNNQATAGSCGRLFRVRPTTGEIVEWNATTTPGTPPAVFTKIPTCVSYYQGYLYFGTYEALDTTANVYATDGSLAVQDNSFNSDNVITMFCQFNGRLFCGTGINKTVVTLASLFSRAPTPGPGSGTGWGGHTFDAARTGNNINGNTYVSMVVYDATTAFVSWHAPSSHSRIYKVTANAPGDPTSTSFTFTSVFDDATKPSPLYLYLDQGVLYAIGSRDGGGVSAWVSTDGGTTWTDKSANFPTTGTSFPIPAFFAVNQ